MSSIVRSLVDWLDDRAGVRDLVNDALYERVVGGSRWRYVWGSALVMTFMTQVVTGIFLWMAYSPSTQTAWESVYFIEHEMTGGWLLRGIHHYMAQMMVILLAIHFVQIVWDGAYRAPRELNFVIGLILMLIVLGLSFTGYLLPWDQKGYWATNVGTELASQTPVVGADLKKVAVGGSDYGHHTLTRFFALHAGVLPALLVGFLVLHITLFRRHGLHAKDPNHGPDAMFWPDQVLKDSVASLGILAAVLAFTVWEGADLMAPADAANPYNAARPEWYFLFLFQFLKWFPGELEIWGAFIIPGIIVTVMFVMPWIGRSRAGHLLNVTLMVVLFGGAAYLTTQALYDDNFAAWSEPPGESASEGEIKAYEASKDFIEAKKDAHYEALRVIELAQSPAKIPPTGALTLVYDDPYLQGPKLYKQNCAGCHNYVDEENPDPRLTSLVNEEPSAPNLFGVGTRKWIEGLLDPEQIVSAHYFGYQGSPFVGDGDNTDMVDFVQESFSEDLDEEQRKTVQAAFKKVAIALSAEAKLTSQKEIDAQDADTIAEGRALIEGGLADVLESGTSCADCHTFGSAEDIGSPVLDGYMSRQWLLAFLGNSADEQFYGDMNDRMPAFAPHDDPRLNQLDQKSLELIVDWLRGDWYRPAEVVDE